MGGLRLSVTFAIHGTTDHADLPDELLHRLYCHALVQRLPAESLAEAVEWLTDECDASAVRKLPTRGYPEPPTRIITGKFLGTRIAEYPSVLELD